MSEITVIPNSDFHAPLRAAAAYDLAARYYDDWKWQRFWHLTEAPLVRDMVTCFTRERAGGLRLLDVGCGTGTYLHTLRGQFGEIHGIDLSGEMLAIAREKVVDAAFRQAHAERLPFGSESFDAVICTRMLSHVDDAAAAVSEMTRLLRSGGVLVLADVDAGHDYEHTKLPVGNSSVYARTVKREAGLVAARLAMSGLFFRAGSFIHLDGGIGKMSSRWLSRRGGAAVVGWVSAWTKP